MKKEDIDCHLIICDAARKRDGVPVDYEALSDPMATMHPFPNRIIIGNRHVVDDLARYVSSIFSVAEHQRPFWVLVRYEDQIRNRLQHMEETFEKLARRNPAQSAVLRDQQFLPGELDSYITGYSLASPDVEDLYRTKSILDGLRVLVRCFDHQLRSLCFINRRMELGSVAGINEIDGIHLWYMFKPGEVIVSDYNQLQAYRY